MYTIFDQNPASLGLLQEVQIIGFFFQMHVRLDNEPHHNVQKTNVVDEEQDDEEELPPEESFILNEGVYLDCPGLS